MSDRQKEGHTQPKGAGQKRARRQLELFSATPRGVGACSEPQDNDAQPRPRKEYPADIDQITLEGERWLDAMKAAAQEPRGTWPRLVFHADMDCFFVAVERLRDPKLEGKPVVVGGQPNSRGVVCSASYEARAYGVRSAMPSAQAARLCPDAVFVPPSGPYSEYSHKVQEVFRKTSPLVQMASLDEGYLELTGLPAAEADAHAYGEHIRRRVREATGLTVSIGGGTSKLVAKVTSGACKPDGCRIIAPGSEADFLRDLRITKVPGMGGKRGEAFASRGLETIGQVRGLGLEQLRAMFGGEEGSRLYFRLHGFDAARVKPRRIAKSTSAERTFDRNIGKSSELQPILIDLAERIGSDLRQSGARASTFTIKMKSPDFVTQTRALPLEPPAQEDRALIDAAMALLRKHHSDGKPLRLIGLCASGLKYDRWQPDIFGNRPCLKNKAEAPQVDPADEKRRSESLYAALDQVRERHGFESVRVASTLSAATRGRPRQFSVDEKTGDETATKRLAKKGNGGKKLPAQKRRLKSRTENS